MIVVLPPSVKRRVKALKNIQVELNSLATKFNEEIHDLEMKYHGKYSHLYDKRSEIVNGKYEPEDNECIWTLDRTNYDAWKEDKSCKLSDSKPTECGDNLGISDVKGVPDFWLTVLLNTETVSEIIYEHDIPVLKHLQDIKLTYQVNPMGFTLFFHFSPNEYFTNSVLIKKYEINCAPDKDDPLSFDGPEIHKCSGCVIQWKPGMNITLNTIISKQRKASNDLITKVKTRDSFFDFFNVPIFPEQEDIVVDPETLLLLVKDFKIGHFIRERIVPRAVLYFTREFSDEDEDWEDEYEESEDIYQLSRSGT